MSNRGVRLGRELLRRLRMSSNSLPFHSGDPLPRLYSSSVTSSSTSSSSFPPAFFGLLSASALGMMELAHADAAEGEGDAGIPVASSPNSEAEDMEKLVRQERQRLEELLQTADVRRENIPAFIVSAKGQKITVKFCVPASCEVSRLIVDLVSHLGVKNEKHGGGSEMLVRAWDSAISWQMTLNYAEESIGGGKRGTGNLCILIYESLVSSGNCEIEFIKDGIFTSSEADALVSVLKLAREKSEAKRTLGSKQWGSTREKQNDPQMERVISSLESMGVRVYGIDRLHGSSPSGDIAWNTIAGYEEQKREIEDTILLSLMSPQVYDEIAWGTRCKFESNRPRAVLFEGPPGTGKTSCARVIANQAGVPLLYVPLEIVVSKYYGESERLLGKVFSLANDLPDGAIIFLDEIDSFAASRDSEIHEATRRMLSVLLRQIDGFEQEKKVIVIAATNRKQDLDPALISRFDTMIPFHLPDHKNREKIASQYAKHLKQSEIGLLADATEGMSGRDIRDVCQQTERHWAAKLIREKTTNESINIQLPSLEEYIKCAEIRSRTLVELNEERKRMISSSPRDRGLLRLL